MNNKNPPLSIVKVCLRVLLFTAIITLLNPSALIAQLISPRISLTSSQDTTGIAASIHGTGFSAGSVATFYVKSPDGSQVAIQNMDISKEGTFNISHLFPSNCPVGSYLLWAVDDSTGKYSNRVNFNMPATRPTEVKTPPSPPSLSYTPQHGDLIR